MFNNLIESKVDAAELRRRSSFMLGTMLCYALLLAAAGVGSIYAYEAHVDNQSLELTSVVTMVPMNSAPKVASEPNSARQPRAVASAGNTAQTPTRTRNQAAVTDMTKVPDGVHVTGDNAPPGPPNVKINTENIIGGGGGPNNLPFTDGGPTGTGTGTHGRGSEITREVPPEMPKAESRPPKTTKRIQSLGVIESKVIQKAVPPYPELAKKVGASGVVTVQILLDEQGQVISARATDGHPLLRSAAEKAAYRTRFSPTLLSNQPVKVSGIITFKFVLR